MLTLLKGADVAAHLNEESVKITEDLKSKGKEACLAILRVGEKDSDLSYERGAVKKAALCNVSVRSVVLPEDVSAEEFYKTLEGLNKDPEVSGILMLRPLPKTIDEEKARKMLAPEKDVDGCTDGSLCKVFTNQGEGFAPCTALAAVEILDYYNIPVSGKKVCVIGRSLVIGRPAAMLLLHKNATVTVCHSKSEDIKEITRSSDIIIAASGQMESLDSSYFKNGQTIIDVGISWNQSKGKLCGDVDFDTLSEMDLNITPVPGGVGAVTTSVLINNVCKAAQYQNI